MKIIVAIDSFKGCLTSAEANQAPSEGVYAKMPDAQDSRGQREGSADANDCGIVSHTGRYGCDRDCQGQWADAAIARGAQSDGGHELRHGPAGGGCRKTMV